MRNEKGQFIKGYKHSAESKKRISKSLIGNKRGLNYKHTEKEIKKISDASKGNKNRLGMKNTDEWRIKFKESHSGEKHWNWKGGLRKEHKRIYEHLRRAIKKGNGGSFTLQEWKDLKKRYGNACPACGLQEPHIKLTMDHIIPLSRGGLNLIENIQPLCKGCNNKKHLKIIAFEKTGQLRMVI